jgi:hypothetical protein
MRAAEQHEFSAIRFALYCVELWWKRHKDNTRPGRTVKSATPFFMRFCAPVDAKRKCVLVTFPLTSSPKLIR